MAVDMRTRLLDLVICPRCESEFVLENADTPDVHGHINSGALVCNGCRTRYPIVAGVPRLLPEPTDVSDDARKTVDRFGEQWNDFDFIGPHYEKQFLGWIGPNTPDTFRGQVVLEGGCGKGRHSALVSKWGAKDVLAIDLGSAVDAAYRNTRHLDNVHVIQADLFHMPVARLKVDIAFSVGVLHHTADPKGSFMALTSKVRPGGKVIAWVYGYENNGWIVHGVSPIRRSITSRLPHRWMYQIAKLPALALFLAGRGVYLPLSEPPFDKLGSKLFYQQYINYIAKFPFKEVHSIVHDHLIPPIAHYLKKEEFERWFEEARLVDVEISWYNENSWRGTAKIPARDTAERATASGASIRLKSAGSFS